MTKHRATLMSSVRCAPINMIQKRTATDRRCTRSRTAQAPLKTILTFATRWIATASARSGDQAPGEVARERNEPVQKHVDQQDENYERVGGVSWPHERLTSS